MTVNSGMLASQNDTCAFFFWGGGGSKSNNNDLVTQLSRKKYEIGGGMYNVYVSLETLENKQKKEIRK
jgi:hypothetical protein